MDKLAAQRLLKGNGTGFPLAEWLILKSLLTAERDPALPTLAAHALRDADRVVKVLVNNALCGWALHACPSLRDAPDKVRGAVEQAAQYEFGACAQRKFALHALDRLAEQRGCHPLVIKGAANALVLYEKESARPSRDIDLVMEPDAIARCFDGLAVTSSEATDFPETLLQFAGYAVEAHPCFISPLRWGRYEDLARDSLPLPGFSALRYPDATIAFTVALLHFAHHFGGFAFDLLDMIRMLDANRVDMQKAMALWKENGLVDLILPGLTVLDTVTPVASDEAWNTLFNGLSRRKRYEVLIGLRLLSAERFSKLRWEWFNSRFAPPTFATRVMRLFIGSTAVTQRQTGLSRTHPFFWFFHLIGLPTKRILLFWK